MNLMILSPGRRCELVKYFKKELNKKGGNLITADMSKYAPALYLADNYYLVDKDFDNLEMYIDNIIKICKKENVSFLLTLIDPELELLSRYRRHFEKNNINLLLSDDACIKESFDKYLFYSKYQDKINLVRTYRNYHEVITKIEEGELKYPLFAKLTNGSASSGTQKINSGKEFEAYKDETRYIYQEYIFGKEIGVDLYFDLISGKIVSLFMKEKIAMRAGETDKSVSVFREDVLTELQKLEKCGNYKGPVDVDVFISEDEKIYINEINPRFGGGYPHAHYCGVDFVKLIMNNIKGIENRIAIGSYELGIVMMKCNKFIFKNGDKIYEE